MVSQLHHYAASSLCCRYLHPRKRASCLSCQIAPSLLKLSRVPTLLTSITYICSSLVGIILIASCTCFDTHIYLHTAHFIFIYSSHCVATIHSLLEWHHHLPALVIPDHHPPQMHLSAPSSSRNKRRYPNVLQLPETLSIVISPRQAWVGPDCAYSDLILTFSEHGASNSNLFGHVVGLRQYQSTIC